MDPDSATTPDRSAPLAGTLTVGGGRPAAPVTLEILHRIEAGALFELDSALNTGRLDDLKPLPRMALALLQFDFATVQALLPRLPDADVRQAVAAAALFQDDPGPAPDLDPDATTDPDPEVEDTARTYVQAMAAMFDDSAAAILSHGPAPEWVSPLHRYIYLRLQIYLRPVTDPDMNHLFPTDTLSEGEIFCLLLYHLEHGRQGFVDIALGRLNATHRKSGHVFYLLSRSALQTNAIDAAKAWMLNAQACQGLDERLDEQLYALFGPAAAGPALPADRDVGLRALRGVAHRGAYAVRRGSLRTVPRPDSPHGAPCFRHADADLAEDVAVMRAAFEAAPSPWTGDPETDPKARFLGIEKRFVAVAPPKSTADLALAASALTSWSVVWFDCWAAIMANIGKLESDGAAPDLAFIEANAQFIRSAWQQMERDRLTVPEGHAVVHMVTDARSVGALRVLWPAARFVLCIPGADVMESVTAGGVQADWFERVLHWRDPRHLARALAVMGVPRARRRETLETAHHLRHLFYPV
ncbi:hypothetical protein [Roseospira navarrensis]|uniref:Uncharacterized protein n=1 Tax=Roseospira navarrensis TaxID=140058 RepID=A0A7X1ZHF6_9PROT|nr:hypothetical protein [Roseospira navarrensis]MQX37275.1 hypothetical protein [Roseospira navarrensis]